MKTTSSTKPFLIFAVFCVVIHTGTASSFALVVPNNECISIGCMADGDLTPYHNGQCFYTFFCNRNDSTPYIQAPGTLSQPTGQDLVCNTCCPDCDCLNPPTLTHICTGSVAIQLTRTFNFTISGGVEAGVPGFKASLQESFGFGGAASNTWTVTAGSSNFPSCQIGRYTVTVATMVGAVRAVSHTYHWTSSLVQGSTPPCPPPGVVWNADCATVPVSTATSDSWGASTVQWLGNTPCP